ncbi:hypothetical protein ACJMK2_004853 [Sinanodonta woodiana]|uniref:Transposase Helix-turn-helix domain-containing protein n=1 Tax=Sinanodonta woodiana TaxID=1069815 RepID=A0ABD3VPV4_SINWO
MRYYDYTPPCTSFRLALVNYLQNCPELQFEGNGGKDPISIEKQLYITLWYLVGLDTINKIADGFGVSEYSVILCRSRLIKTILHHLKQIYFLGRGFFKLRYNPKIFQNRDSLLQNVPRLI